MMGIGIVKHETVVAGREFEKRAVDGASIWSQNNCFFWMSLSFSEFFARS